MPQDENFLSFDEIFEELNYRQAQRTLRDIVANLDLSERERRGLEEPLEELQQMLDKLERQVLQIAVFGMVGRGKSSVLNALMGGQVFETGPLHGVTTSRQAAEWQISREAMQTNGDRTILKASFQGRGEARIELIDTPGIDEVDGEGRAELAKRIAQQADLILFIVAGDITKVEYDALSELRGASKPILLVFNKIDQYPPEDRLAIYAKIRDERVRELLTEDEIVMTAAITQAVAIAVNPFTVIDVISAAIIDISMIVALSKLYGINMSNRGAISLMQKIAIGMGGISASEFLATFGLSSLKGLLGIAAPVTGGLTLGGYVSVAIAQAGVAGFSTYALGLVTKEYLANGASWGADGPKAVVKRILDTIDEDSILARIKDELRAKIDLRRLRKI